MGAKAGREYERGEIINMNNLHGQKVYHKSFGQGSVIDQDATTITISFSQDDKRFIYPDAFKNFLTAVDPTTDAALKKIIEDIETTKIQAKKQKIEAEKPVNVEGAKHISTIRKVRKVKSCCLEKNSSSGQQYFFVFQNKSFDAEQRSGFLWAPKSHNGRTFSHWKLMQEVREGDVIFHSVKKNIVAISIAVSNCYSSEQPNDLKQERLWEDDGRRVDSKYTMIRYPIVTSDYLDTILELQPSQYAPFNVRGGNTGYLFASNYALSKFLFDKLIVKNTYLKEITKDIGLGQI